MPPHNEEWQEVSAGIVTLGVGDVLIGTYVDVTTIDVHGESRPVHMFKDPNGAEFGTWSSYELDQKLEGLKGRMVKVVLVDIVELDEMMPDGRNKMVKKYRVFTR